MFHLPSPHWFLQHPPHKFVVKMKWINTFKALKSVWYSGSSLQWFTVLSIQSNGYLGSTYLYQVLSLDWGFNRGWWRTISSLPSRCLDCMGRIHRHSRAPSAEHKDLPYEVGRAVSEIPTFQGRMFERLPKLTSAWGAEQGTHSLHSLGLCKMPVVKADP